MKVPPNTDGIVEELEERFGLWWNEHPGIDEKFRDLLWLTFQGGAAALKDTLCDRGIVRPDYT